MNATEINARLFEAKKIKSRFTRAAICAQVTSDTRAKDIYICL